VASAISAARSISTSPAERIILATHYGFKILLAPYFLPNVGKLSFSPIECPVAGSACKLLRRGRQSVIPARIMKSERHTALTSFISVKEIVRQVNYQGSKAVAAS